MIDGACGDARQSDDALAAIEAVYRDRFAGFVRLAHAITGDEQAALDAVHDAFVRAVRYRRNLRDSESAAGWICRIVINEARRSRRTPPRVEVPEASSTDGHDDGADVRAALAALPERQRLALFLRYYADLDYAAIGAALGIATRHGVGDAPRRPLEPGDAPQGGHAMSELMERAVPPYTGTGDWGAVLRDAGAARRRARLRRALAFAVVAAALVVAWQAAAPSSTIDRALAAAGDGRVLHLGLRGLAAEAARRPRTGERSELRGTHEVWFDPATGARERETFAGVLQWESLNTTGHGREIYSSLGTGYRDALRSGSAKVVGETDVGVLDPDLARP